MSEEAGIKQLDHELAEDELAWMQAVYEDFGKIRAAFSGRDAAFDPKKALREVLGREQHRLAAGVDLSGPGPGGSAKTVTAAALPLSSCQGWSCTGTRKAAPTSSPCTWSARRMRSPSARTRNPCLPR